MKQTANNQSTATRFAQQGRAYSATRVALGRLAELGRGLRASKLVPLVKDSYLNNSPISTAYATQSSIFSQSQNVHRTNGTPHISLNRKKRISGASEAESEEII